MSPLADADLVDLRAQPDVAWAQQGGAWVQQGGGWVRARQAGALALEPLEWRQQQRR